MQHGNRGKVPDFAAVPVQVVGRGDQRAARRPQRGGQRVVHGVQARGVPGGQQHPGAVVHRLAQHHGHPVQRVDRQLGVYRVLPDAVPRVGHHAAALRHQVQDVRPVRPAVAEFEPEPVVAVALRQLAVVVEVVLPAGGDVPGDPGAYQVGDEGAASGRGSGGILGHGDIVPPRRAHRRRPADRRRGVIDSADARKRTFRGLPAAAYGRPEPHRTRRARPAHAASPRKPSRTTAAAHPEARQKGSHHEQRRAARPRRLLAHPALRRPGDLRPPAAPGRGRRRRRRGGGRPLRQRGVLPPRRPFRRQRDPRGLPAAAAVQPGAGRVALRAGPGRRQPATSPSTRSTSGRRWRPCRPRPTTCSAPAPA